MKHSKDSNVIPKVELHCHLDGVLDRAMLRDIRRGDPTFPIDPAELEQAYPADGFEGFINWFRFTGPLYQDLVYLYPLLSRHIQQLKAQSVVYAELMIPSSDVPKDREAAVDQYKALREWVSRHKSDDFQLEFLIAVGRNKSPEEVEERAARVLPLYEAGLVVGVALAGPEQGHPVKPFHKTFARFHEAGLGIEIHAGEWCGPESVWDALEYGYPDRIGHGVCLFQDARLIDLVRERNLHIEMCPTSNVKTRSISRIEDHPIAQAHELGLNFSVNTDDPGIFECSMESEYELLAKVFGFTGDDWRTVYANSLRARFQPRPRIKEESA